MGIIIFLFSLFAHLILTKLGADLSGSVTVTVDLPVNLRGIKVKILLYRLSVQLVL